MTKKLERFLALHNRLSSFDFQATMEMVICFRDENTILFAGDNWSIEEMRHPFLLWLRRSFRKAEAEKSKKGEWVTFPRPSNL